MSDHEVTAPKPERFELRSLGLIPWMSLVIGIGAIGAALAWSFFEPRQFAFSWLFGFMFVFTICAGSLFWILLHHAVDANWSVVVRRVLESYASLFLPWIAIFFIPLIFFADQIYLWWSHAFGEGGYGYFAPQKAVYFNPWFLGFRTVGYFVVFAVLAWLLRRWSTAQDKDGLVVRSIHMRQLSNGGLVLFGVCISFAAIDWLMSLDYHWFSTMWGVYIFAGSALSSMAVLILTVNGLHQVGYLKGVFTREHNHIMGKLLFAFTVFWAYIAFSQYMLIYYANIPEEHIFYIHRNTGTWKHLSIFLVFGHFFAPFLMLLTQPAKRNPLRLSIIAAWILFMHVVDLFWIVIPYLSQILVKKKMMDAAEVGFALHPLNILTVGGLACLAFFFFLRRLGQHNILPLRDPRLYESMTLKN